MNKSHKQEMFSLLNTMGKMADLLPKLDNPHEQIQDLLAACECLKENLEQENAPKSTDLLQAIENSLKENKFDIIENIKKLESAFKSEVKTKVEVLFLPYKASMWDSLESIYLAAKEDPACEAFVMPIPYYDKKDGKFTQMYWEIDYPKNIPLIDYRKYNIEERHPDIIFVHNPYDGYNIVTSVHPDFYSERLRNLTDNLVYVPYFVGNGKNIQEHFCTLPGCIFAHKVIVQTEEEKKIYVSEYKKFAKNNKVFERFDQIADKFLALGSPKLDKAVNAKREDFEISEEWEKLIAGKKVIFYNTSIGALLENSVENNKPSNKYLQKIKKVFEAFKIQSDAVLLWRPHPLLESTIKSMRPWLEQEYAEIVNEYKSGGYGIYDDSCDLNRAIALSDAYYGDGSSVAHLFKAAEKPILGQSFALNSNYGFYADRNFVWLIDSLSNLYKYNKQSKKTEYIGTIPAENYSANLHIAENNGKLYFAPHYKNNKISVFDMDKKIFEKINYRDNCENDIKFQKPISFKNFIYFIPSEFTAIMRLNTETNEIEYFSQWVDEVSKQQVSKIQEAWKNKIFWDSCVVDTEFAVVICGTNAVMFFNMETCSYEIKNIGEKSEQYHNICFVGQNYYLTSLYKDYIIKWDRKSNKASKIKFPSSFSRKTGIYANFIMRSVDEYILLFPTVANNAYKINTKTNEITELPELVEHFKNKDLVWHYNFILIAENFVYASTLNKGIVEYDINTRTLSFIDNIHEGRENKEKFLLLSLINNYSNDTSAENKNSGEEIWKYCYRSNI